jgi:transaldolase
MAIYLDSAIHDQVREAMAWGFLTGVTTNPALLATAGADALDALQPLCQLVPGQVFFQLTTHSVQSMLLQAQAAFSVSPSQIVLAVPCTMAGLQAVSRLSLEFPCAVTAVFSPAQAYLAKEAGARYVLPYVNRATELLGDGITLVDEISQVLVGDGPNSIQIVAADIKTSSEAVAALKAGAHHLALPFELVKRMAHHPLSDQALQESDLVSGS